VLLYVVVIHHQELEALLHKDSESLITAARNTMVPPASNIDLGIDYAYGSTKAAGTRLGKPLKYSGNLDEYDSFDVTAVIGREYPSLQLSEILNDDAKLRDLAITGQLSSFCFDLSTRSKADRTLENSVRTGRCLLPQPGS